MEIRRLGRTGLKVSVLCLGSMQFGWTADEELSLKILSFAWEAGINFIDTADIYSKWVPGNPGGISESIIGNWIEKAKIPREKIILATKVRQRLGDGANDEGLSRIHIMNAIEGSLRRLKTDYIDLYQAHAYDANAPIEETLRAMETLIQQGKVRYIGCSNYSAWRLMQALWASDRMGIACYDSIQPHYNLVNRSEFERELVEVCQQYGIGVIPYSPLAGGFLTDRYNRNQTAIESQRNVSRYFNDRNWNLIDSLQQIAKLHNASVSQVSLAWLLAQPVVTSPIIGPRNIEQLNDNLGCLQVQLSQKQLDLIDQASAWK
jgi:aryl-alcohol dehydrogenase-like predicted oxidoreductase